MNKKKNKIILTSFIISSIAFLPVVGLISCENEVSKEKRLVKENIDNLEKVLNSIREENKTSYNSKSFVEAFSLIKETKQLIDNFQGDLVELRKIKNVIKKLTADLNAELENYRTINEANDNKPSTDPNLEYPNEQFESDFRNLTSSKNIEDNFILSFTNFYPQREKSNIYPSELQNQSSSLGVKSRNEDYNKKIEFIVNNIILENDANTTGKAKINLVFRNKANNSQKNFIFELKGLNKNFTNTDSQGNRPNNRVSDEKIEETDFDKYEALDQFGRFKHDNDKYVSSLKRHLSSNGYDTLAKFRPNLNINNSDKQAFDARAESLKLDTFDNSAFKGFTLPSYKSDGSFDGLEIYENETGKQASLIDSLGKKDIYKTIGLARTIVNEHYLKIAKQTFSLSLSNYKTWETEINENKKLIEFWRNEANEAEFVKNINEKVEKLKEDRKAVEDDWNEKIKNNNDVHLKEAYEKNKEKDLKTYDDTISYYKNHTRAAEIINLENQIREWEIKRNEKRETLTEAGTIWILDYQPTTNGKYPSKWYFGTNAHVAKALTENLSAFSITKINNDLQVGAKLRISDMDDNITRFSSQNKNAIKTVFSATDYLKTSPKQFLSKKQQETFKDIEEFADFAVIEIDFDEMSKNFFAISNDEMVDNKLRTKPNFNLAKEITNDYANNQDVHIKFKQNSYLKNYSEINFPLRGKVGENIDNLYALGWPGSRTDFFLKQYIDDDQRERAKFGNSFSLWTNSEYEYYDAKITSGENGPSSFPENILNRGSFLSYQIGYRSFADKPGVLDSFISSPTIGGKLYEQDGKKYVNMSLSYIPRRWAPTGGSSGSSIRNQNNELVAVHHVTNTFARIGISIAFRSEGFDYRGLFGSYNLPQYDLIYGGGKEQKNSYREALKKLYPNLQSTNLFKNGLDDNNIPIEFKFINGGTR